MILRKGANSPQGGKAKVAGKAMYRTTNPEQAAQTAAAELESRLARLLEE